MIHTFLPTIAFCFEQKTLLKNILQDITENFSRRSVLIHSLPIKHPQELTAYAAKSILPDILVFSDFSDSDSSKELLRNILF